MARLLTLLLLTGLLLVGTYSPSSAEPAAGRPVAAEQTLGSLVGQLVVARERNRGYDRDKFVHWVDGDGDGCDTRDEVLRQEAKRAPAVGSGCSLSGGRWFSWYDGERVTDAGDLDIDHLVPLAEAWGSGARTWSARTRQRFANDLRDRRSLTAVTASSNRSKSDRDPAEWLPRPAARCRYVRDWVVVKSRWQLAVDRTEKRTVRRLVRGCGTGDDTVRFRRARVVRR